MVETADQPEDEILSLNKTVVPTHETVFHYHALGKPFENAFKQYVNLDPDDLKKIIDSLPDESKKGDPNFLGLKFEDLFNIPVEVARTDINTVTQLRREGNVESLERTIDLNANINEDDFSILGVNTLRDYFISLNNSTLAPFPPPAIELPPPINTSHGTPTTPYITFDSAFTGGKNTEVLLNTQNSVTLQGNIFSFGAGGGSNVNAFFAPPARPGSVEDRSQTGEVILTTPEGNTLTFYTNSINGHVAGDIVYVLNHAILTPPEPFTIISGKKVHKDLFQYSVTDSFADTNVNTIEIQIIDDVPVATNQNAPSAMSESNIQNIGSNELGTVNTLSGSLIVPSIQATPPGPGDLSDNRFGANGGSVTNVSVAGGSTVFNGFTYTVTDANNNTLVVNKSTGNYVYTLNAPFHNTNNQPFNEQFSYQFTDNELQIASAVLTVTINDDAPVAVNLSKAISEANILNIGLNQSNIIATVSGLLVPTSPTTSTSRYGADGPASGGGVTNATLTSESGTSGVTGLTTFGTITNTQITNSNGAFTNANLGHASIIVTDTLGNTLVIDRITNQYVYTLNAAFTDASNNPAVLTYTYQLTDSDGSTSSASLVITVADDTPHAVNLSNTISEANIKTIGSNDLNNFATISGLLVPVAPTTSDSRYGADGPASGGGVTNATLASESGTSGVTGLTTFGTITNTQITNSNGAFTNANLGHASIIVTDTLGNTLVIDRVTNQYVYTLNAAFTDASNNPAVLTYTYQLTDSDGSTSSANLVITVADDAPHAVNLSNTISEANIKTIGSNDLNNFATISGLLVPVAPTTSDSRYGADGPASGGGVTNATLTSESGTSGVTGLTTFGTITNTQITNSNGAFTNANLGHASIIVTDTLGNTLVIDRITNQYVYTLNAAFTDASNNPAVLTYTYQLTDSDGSTSSANIEITVADDAPHAVNLSNTISEANIKTIGSNASNNFATISGLLVPVAPTTSDSRYGADGPASGGGVTNATLASETAQAV